MKTDYAAHDERYRQLRADGGTGWDGPSDLADHLSELPFYDPWLPGGGHLLELGCGAGDIVLRYAARGFTVAGIDISPTAIAWASDKAGQDGVEADLRVGDVLALPWPDESFDVVLDGHCLHCIIGDDRATFLSEARRVLRGDGVMLVGTMCGDVTSPRILEGYDPKTRLHFRGDVASRYFGEAESILEELAAAELEVVASEVRPRANADDQDILLAVSRRAPPAAGR